MTTKILFVLITGLSVSMSSYAMRLSSPAFKPFHRIPANFTCKGDDVSPPLHWTDVPAGTRSYVLTMADPDAANGVWDHWILFNIPITVAKLPENPEQLPAGTKVGKNSWGKQTYNGPCPPKGKHRYVFTLYALDSQLDLPEDSNKAQVLAALAPYEIDKATLTGVFTQ